MFGFVKGGEALLLIALGIGYLVVYFAKREEKGLRFCGYVIGGAIITLTIIYLLGSILFQAKMCRLKGYDRGLMQQRMMPEPPAQRP